MPEPPMLTVYMPLYNAERYVGAAIESILAQTFSDFELLVVDDGSTDGSAAVVESIGDARVRLIRQENRGCYPARNRAIAEARGRYLANMDADDLSLPTRFEKQIAYLEAHPEAVLVGTKTYECDMDDSVRLPRRDFFSYADGLIVRDEDVQVSPPFTLPSILFRRSLVERMRGYDERLCFCSDWDFVSRASFEGRVACLNEPLYVFRILPTSISSVGGRIQSDITEIIRSANDRARGGGTREFTAEEANRIQELAAKKDELPRSSQKSLAASYEIRLAILHRVNGNFMKSLHHSLRAISFDPLQLLTNRKLQSNLLHSILRKNRLR